MVKPKRKLSKVVIVGVTTSTKCFNCYCHQPNGGIKPYQRLAKRRRPIRFRNRSGLPFKYRFENIFISAVDERWTTWKNASWCCSCCNVVDEADRNCRNIDFFVAFMNFSLNVWIFFFLFNRKSGDNSGSRQIRNTPDWSDNAVSGDHLWVPTSVSGDCCYVGDNDCTVSSLTFLYPLECVCYMWTLAKARWTLLRRVTFNACVTKKSWWTSTFWCCLWNFHETFMNRKISINHHRRNFSSKKYDENFLSWWTSESSALVLHLNQSCWTVLLGISL